MIDFEQDANEQQSEIPSDDKIATISRMAESLITAQQKLAQAEAEATKWRAEVEKYSLVELPLALKNAGVKKFVLDNGIEIGVKQDIFASITEANREAAHEWLAEHGYADVIKSTVSMQFGRGESENRDQLLEVVKDLPFAQPVVKESVHASTLKALIRERIASGKETPTDLFSIFEKEEAFFNIKK